MARTSHKSLMDSLRGTAVWNAITNKDFERAKRLIDEEAAARETPPPVTENGAGDE